MSLGGIYSYVAARRRAIKPSLSIVCAAQSIRKDLITLCHPTSEVHIPTYLNDSQKDLHIWSCRVSNKEHSGKIRFCCGPLGDLKMAKICRLVTHDVRSEIHNLSHATSAGRFAALTLNRILVNFSILSKMWTTISLA